MELGFTAGGMAFVLLKIGQDVFAAPQIQFVRFLPAFVEIIRRTAQIQTNVGAGAYAQPLSTNEVEAGSLLFRCC